MRKFAVTLTAIAAAIALSLVGCSETGQNATSVAPEQIQEAAPSPAMEVPVEYEDIPDELIDENVRRSLAYLVTPRSESGFDDAGLLDTNGTAYPGGSGSLLGRDVDIRIWYDGGDATGELPATYVDMSWPEGLEYSDLCEEVIDVLGSDYSERTDTSALIPIPGTDLSVYAVGFDGNDVNGLNSVYIVRAEYDAELRAYASIDDLPDELENQAFRDSLALLGEPFSESGLSAADGMATDEGTMVFYVEGIEFVGISEWGKSGSPRIAYETDGVESGVGTPLSLTPISYNVHDGNGYREAVDMVEKIAAALGYEEAPEIENDFGPTDPSANGTYYTFTLESLGITMTVEGSDAYTSVVIKPIMG